MTTRKILLLLLSLWGLQGCLSTNSSYYILSVSPQPENTYRHINGDIGVEKITIPSYLYKREIAIAKSNSQITLLGGAVWGEDLDTGLTKRLISFLQKKFNQPNIYAYPWGVDRQPVIKVKVDVTRFIAYGDKVYLDANWEVEHIKTQKRKARLFSTTVTTKSDADSIVSSMNEAFSQLEKKIAMDVKKY